MPRALRLLIARLLGEVNKATRRLERGQASVTDWRTQMERHLKRYHAAAMLAGIRKGEMNDAQRRYVDERVKVQLKFLNQFATEIAEGDEWRPGYTARAALYAEAIKAPYWAGSVDMLPLPAMPGDGSTQCLGRCGCSWDIRKLADGDYDCTWIRGKRDSCQTCIQRAGEWAPLRIRGGELQ